MRTIIELKKEICNEIVTINMVQDTASNGAKTYWQRVIGYHDRYNELFNSAYRNLQNAANANNCYKQYRNMGFEVVGRYTFTDEELQEFAK